MSEMHEIYRVGNISDLQGLATQLNMVLSMISNRLDKMEGLRDDPAFYSSNFKYPATTVSGFLKAGTNEADFDPLTYDDLNLTTTLIDDGYVKILDSNGTVIHQLGDET